MNITISEHLLILQDYMATQKELIKLMEEEPADEFEANSYIVRVQETNQAFERLSEQLSLSIKEIAKIQQ